MLRKSWTAVLSTALLGALTALGSDPDPKQLLEKINTATDAVKAVTYDAEMYIEADGKKQDESAGKFKSMKTPDGPPRFQGELYNEGAPVVLVSTDGQAAVKINHKRKNYAKADAQMINEVVGEVFGKSMAEYVLPKPFEQEVNAPELKYEGKKDVAGVDCHVILVNYGEDFAPSRWYFGKEDLLPRRVDRLMEQGAQVTVVKNLQVNPKMDDVQWTPAQPEGYSLARVGPLAAGDEAPNWTLPTPDGKTLSLADLKGKVVLMDFWAVWCGPCKRAMPAVQKLHEAHKDKGLVVLGVNTWEKETNDPVKFMKDNNFTYPLVLKADEVAREYGVSGIPTFYLIGADGKVIYTAVGSGDEEKLEAAITKALAARQ